VSRSLKSALAIAAVVVTFGLSGGPAAVAADAVVNPIVNPTGGATGCCRLVV